MYPSTVLKIDRSCFVVLTGMKGEAAKIEGAFCKRVKAEELANQLKGVRDYVKVEKVCPQ